MLFRSTSYHALKQSAGLQAGETVLVLGAAGGVSITAVECARAMGARVIAAASSAEKLEFARAADADEVINYSQESLRDRCKTLTGGKGVDVVYDPVGGELAQPALRALAWHGRYLVIGFASGDILAFPANIALLKEASIIGAKRHLSRGSGHCGTGHQNRHRSPVQFSPQQPVFRRPHAEADGRPPRS